MSASQSLFCTAQTTAGAVQGLVSSGVRQFKAVPYGAPTGGANRFMPPRPPEPWTGVRACFGGGQASPQIPTDLGHDYGRLLQLDLSIAAGGMGEDCLHLNVWTPGLDDGARRPVMVSFHGGGFAIGSGNGAIYDGAHLAKTGDVVVVSVTHRLASFGFLNLADIGAPAEFAQASVTGLMDLVAALEWVRDNIANFGGDPGRVMIFGQSGGGWKVSALLGAPAAKGLFHRAAVQSGSLLRHTSREDAARAAELFVQKLGLDRQGIANIQSLPWQSLLAAQAEIGAHAFAPSLDGRFLTEDPFDPIATEVSADVPLIVSTTLDDAGLFMSNFDLDEDGLSGLLRARYGDQADRMLGLYRTFWPDKSPFLLQAQIITDSGFRRFAHAQAERKAAQGRAPVYAYLWEWASPAYGGKFGAAHAMDVSASFGNARDAILGAGSHEARFMSEALAAAWVNFARTGDPNNASMPRWPAFDGANRATMVLGPYTRVVNDPYEIIRKLWRAMPEAASVLG